MFNLFTLWKQRVLSDEHDVPKIIWWWDVFYRYEFWIALVIGAVLSLLGNLVLAPLWQSEETFLKIVLGFAAVGAICSGAIAGLAASPFFRDAGDNSMVRRYDIGPGRMLLVTLLSYAGLAAVGFALFKLLASGTAFGITAASISVVLLVLVAPAAYSYAKWRIDVISKYPGELGYSSVFRTSRTTDQDVHNLQRFKSYKANLAIILIAGQLVFGAFVPLFIEKQESEKKQTEAAAVAVEQRSEPDSAKKEKAAVKAKKHHRHSKRARARR